MRKYLQEIFGGFFKDENGEFSSKRLLGIIGGLSLVTYMFIYPSEYSNSSVLLMVLTMMGINGMEKIFKKGK